MALFETGGGDKCNLKNIEDWIKNKRVCFYERFTHFAYITETNQLCLAKVIDTHLKLETIRLFLEISSDKFDKKKYRAEFYYKIQIGDVDDVHQCKSWKLG